MAWQFYCWLHERDKRVKRNVHTKREYPFIYYITSEHTHTFNCYFNVTHHDYIFSLLQLNFILSFVFTFAPFSIRNNFSINLSLHPLTIEFSFFSCIVVCSQLDLQLNLLTWTCYVCQLYVRHHLAPSLEQLASILFYIFQPLFSTTNE